MLNFKLLVIGIVLSGSLNAQLVKRSLKVQNNINNNNSNESKNDNYTNNKAPLLNIPFIPLPLSLVKAEGWLLVQLKAQKDGLTGNAEMLYSEDNNLGANCDWLGGTGDSWERVPYYVKGLTALAYTLNDSSLILKTPKWINWTLDHQRVDGYFGPAKNSDWWCRMPMLYAVKDFYEATNDKRILPFLTRYFQYENSNIDANPLNSWGRSRAGDNIDIVFWLYNRTGDGFLLTLADKLHKQAYDWTDIFTRNTFIHFGEDYQPKHNVNVPQALKMPPIFYQRSNKPSDRDAFIKGYDNLMRDHGQPYGMESGNEKLAGRSSITGLETCSTVEQMQSCEEAQMILGDASIGDILEKVTFNALPAAFTNDYLGLSYYIQSNEALCKNGSHGYEQDYYNGALFGPYTGYQCCRFNAHMGWPYYVKNMWAATADNGIAAMAYGPCQVTAKVAHGTNVTISEKTDYPFDETLKFKISLSQSASFPIKFRIPAWCATPFVKVNGKIQKNVKPGTFYSINRNWQNDDIVVLELPMNIKINNEVNNAVSVDRGPIVYSLKIIENTNIRTDYKNGFVEKEILPLSPWNYGLVIDKNHPEKSFTVNKTPMPANPFIQATTPVTLTATACRLPDWQLNLNGIMALDPPYSPVASVTPDEKITLVPFGAEKLRITSFPVIGNFHYISKVFNCDFNNESLEGWVNYTGSFYIDKGELICTFPEGGSDFKLVQTGTKFSDFSYETKVQLLSGKNNGGVIFRVKNASMGTDNYCGYYVGISAEGYAVLGKSNGNWTEIKKVMMPINKDVWYKMKIVAKGSNIKLFINDIILPVIDVENTSFSEGSIGVRAFEAQIKYDDIVVKSIPF